MQARVVVCIGSIVLFCCASIDCSGGDDGNANVDDGGCTTCSDASPGGDARADVRNDAGGDGIVDARTDGNTDVPTTGDGGPPYVGDHPCPGAEHFVSSGGSASGDGSMSSPWDLSTALAQPSSVKPGDVIWLLGGTYGSGGSTHFSSAISGTATSPICVRAHGRERVTLNGTLTIAGEYAWYWGFEVEQDGWSRVGGSGGADGINFDASAGRRAGNKMIDLVIHDVLDGIADQQESTASESYGNVIFNIGYSAIDRGHGHALYLQNATTDVKIARENIGYDTFDIGIQLYGEASPVSHIHLDGNVAFDSGLPYAHRTDNVIVSGGSVAKADIEIDEQIAYDPLDADSANTGYNILGSSGGADLTVRDGWWIGATPSAYGTLTLQGWDTLHFAGNTVVGSILETAIGTNDSSKNVYWNATAPSGDTTSTTHSGNPTGVNVFVRPSFYEKGRANIIVLNWDKTPTVDVDISGIGLSAGQELEVRDVQNYFGAPVLTTTYSGAKITLPMNLTEVTPFLGFSPTPPHTSQEFGAFVLLPH